MALASDLAAAFSLIQQQQAAEERKASRSQDIALALSGHDLRSEEAEKNRQFQESQTYLANMLATERDLATRIYDKIDEAEDYGLNVTSAIDSLDAVLATSNGQELAKLGEGFHQQKLDSLKNAYGGLTQDISLFNKGRRVSSIIDANKDKVLSGDEFLAYQDELQETDPEYALPEALKLGAQYAITDPESRLKELQLEGAKIGIAKGEQEVKLAKARIQEIQSKVGKEVADAYKASGVLATGTPSYQDLAVGEAVKAEWQYMEPNMLHQMVSNTLVTYDDPVSDQIDKEDIQYAIVPYIKKYAEDKIANLDYREAVGLTDQDVEAENEKYLKVIRSITSNALSGVRLNEGYTLKSQQAILESRTMTRAAMKQMFSDSELGTYNQAVATLTNVLPIEEDTGLPSEGHIEFIQDHLKASGIKWSEAKIKKEYMRLRGAADPYAIAITIQKNPDSSTLLNSLGQESFVAIMQEATTALQSTPGAPVRRTAIKNKKMRPSASTGIPPETPPGFEPAYPYEPGPASSLGQANLDARIRDAALISLDLADAKEAGNVAQSTKLLQELNVLETQIQEYIDEGFLPGTGSLQDITLGLPMYSNISRHYGNQYTLLPLMVDALESKINK